MLNHVSVLVEEVQPFIVLDLALAVEEAGGKSVGPAPSCEEAPALLANGHCQAKLSEVRLHACFSVFRRDREALLPPPIPKFLAYAMTLASITRGGGGRSFPEVSCADNTWDAIARIIQICSPHECASDFAEAGCGAD